MQLLLDGITKKVGPETWLYGMRLAPRIETKRRFVRYQRILLSTRQRPFRKTLYVAGVSQTTRMVQACHQ